MSKLGLYLFAGSMVIFGIQHFMYAGLLATLVTAWIPWHLFWIYFTGAGFIAAGVTEHFGGDYAGNYVFTVGDCAAYSSGRGTPA
ncbi:MAG: hypothetical protein WCE61_15940 [Candidatus Acidiferrum sp.]